VAHNLKVVGSNPSPATNFFNDLAAFRAAFFCQVALTGWASQRFYGVFVYHPEARLMYLIYIKPRAWGWCIASQGNTHNPNP